MVQTSHSDLLNGDSGKGPHVTHYWVSQRDTQVASCSRNHGITPRGWKRSIIIRLELN